ncbi:MAG: von Willebrand factor type A domain-containing protein [Pseudomonadota bacterium]
MLKLKLCAGAAVFALTLAACESIGTAPGPEKISGDVADAGNDTGLYAEGEEAFEVTAPAPTVRRAVQMTAGAAPPPPRPQPLPGDIDRENYENVEINPVKLVAEEPVSTFSIDVDTASYANVRRYLNRGVLPPKDAVRIEELVNYFDYAYPLPETADTPFSTNVQITPSPWSEGRELMHVGIQGYEIEAEERPPLNLTLLVDVSGSMEADDKLPLARKALKMLVDELGEEDRVAIAVYAGAAGAVLEPTPGVEKAKIAAALDNMSAGGSTAGGEGLRLAYALAEQNFDEDSVNRVMLLTDGDFNVGIADPERLEDFVSRKRNTGVYLSVLGFGQGNYNDALMQKIAQTGNGMATYIDTLNEARKVLSDDLSGSLFPIANDVKIQIEFNPARVAEYRLIGYETRLLNREDFNNDQVDAGDIGAGHSVTAVYELTPAGSDARLIDDVRYAANSKSAVDPDVSAEYAFLKLRYKLPGDTVSKLVTRPIINDDKADGMGDASRPARFATAVAAYGQLLRGDPYLSDAFGYDDIIDLANDAKGVDEFGYRSEFVQLVRSAKSAAAQEALKRPGGGGD